MYRKNCQGFIPLAVLGVGFLVLSLVTITAAANDTVSQKIISAFAKEKEAGNKTQQRIANNQVQKNAPASAYTDAVVHQYQGNEGVTLLNSDPASLSQQKQAEQKLLIGAVGKAVTDQTSFNNLNESNPALADQARQRLQALVNAAEAASRGTGGVTVPGEGAVKPSTSGSSVPGEGSVSPRIGSSSVPGEGPVVGLSPDEARVSGPTVTAIFDDRAQAIQEALAARTGLNATAGVTGVSGGRSLTGPNGQAGVTLPLANGPSRVTVPAGGGFGTSLNAQAGVGSGPKNAIIPGVGVDLPIVGSFDGTTLKVGLQVPGFHAGVVTPAINSTLGLGDTKTGIGAYAKIPSVGAGIKLDPVLVATAKVNASVQLAPGLQNAVNNVSQALGRVVNPAAPTVSKPDLYRTDTSTGANSGTTYTYRTDVVKPAVNPVTRALGKQTVDSYYTVIDGSGKVVDSYRRDFVNNTNSGKPIENFLGELANHGPVNFIKALISP